MKLTVTFLLFFTFSFATAIAQSGAYSTLIQEADSLYDAKQYAASATTYNRAFLSNGDLGTTDDRYNAACSWALAGDADAAFHQLQRIAEKGGYANLAHLTTDTDLSSLHVDPRWPRIVESVRQNKARADVGKDTALIRRLEEIYYTDQHYRMQVDAIDKKWGWKSPQMDSLWRIIQYHDSVNLVEVKRVLDTRGWLGPADVGEQGSTTLFLVIQHADSATQAHYIPMMRAAVSAGKAKGSHLALMEDRLLLAQGEMQTYGSQISQNTTTNAHYVRPLRDPDRVDERRAKMGLPPLADYVKRWNISWNPEQYKKDLPAILKYEGMD